MATNTAVHLPTGAIALLSAALVATALLWLVAAAAPAAGEPAKVHFCDDVVVQFEPEGSGGGTDIRSENLGCAKARKVVRKCINNELGAAWSAEYWRTFILLRKNAKEIRYTPVGGGGCVEGALRSGG